MLFSSYSGIVISTTRTEHSDELRPNPKIARCNYSFASGTHLANHHCVPSATVQRIAGAKLLWVDDHPENNLYPRKAMEELGIQITLSTSTEDALEKVHANSYDVIISDMGRQPSNPQAPYEKTAGYDLLDKLRSGHINTPFIIYAGSGSPEHRKETQRHGGMGTTNNAQELLQMVINAIQQE